MKSSENIRALMDVITKKGNDKAFRMKIARTIIFFILSKGVAFISPIILIGYVSLLEYGKIEYSYGVGRLICGCALLGIAGAYPYFMLKKKETDKEMYFYLYGFIGLIASCIILLLQAFVNVSEETALSYLFTFVFACQVLYGNILKTEDKGYKGVLFDSGYYFLLAFIILLHIFIPSIAVVKVLKWGMWLNILAYSLYFIYRYFNLKHTYTLPFEWTPLLEILKYGIPLVFSGFIMYWLTSCARVYIGQFIGYEAVGIYSFYFRLVGISVVIQHFLYIAFFKKLYMGDSAFLDKYYVIVMTLILLCCIVVSLISIPIVSHFMPDKDFSDIKLMVLLSIQMPIWVGISFCEGLTGRENIVIKMNIRLVVIVSCFALFLLLMRDYLNLHIFTLGMISQFCIAFATQLFMLRKKNVLLPKCMIINGMFFILGIITYLV